MYPRESKHCPARTARVATPSPAWRTTLGRRSRGQWRRVMSTSPSCAQRVARAQIWGRSAREARRVGASKASTQLDELVRPNGELDVRRGLTVGHLEDL